MIPRALLYCVAISVALHAGAGATLMPKQTVDVAGQAGGPARLGNSFRDIASGSAVPVPVSARIAPSPVSPVPARQALPEVGPVAPDAVRAAPIAPRDPADAEAISSPVAPTDRAVSLHGLAAAAAPSVAPRAVTKTAPRVDVTPVVTAVEPVGATAATPGTPRPRPDPAARPDPPTPATPPTPPGGEAEARGTAQGAETSTAAEQGEGRAASAVGNAAADSYPGAVMRAIQRTRKPPARSRGTATVGFIIANDGGLAEVRILRSSGKPDLDAAALEHLRRSAPFAPPPDGARRRFQVEYVGS